VDTSATPNKKRAMIKGISTAACPAEITNPENIFFLPSETAAANNGPGAITPLSEISMTVPRKTYSMAAPDLILYKILLRIKNTAKIKSIIITWHYAKMEEMEAHHKT